MSRYDLSVAKLGELMKDSESMAILEKHLGKTIKNPMIKMVKNKSVDAVFDIAKAQVDAQTLANLRAELEALE